MTKFFNIINYGKSVIKFFNDATDKTGIMMYFKLAGQNLGQQLTNKIETMQLSGMSKKAIYDVLRNDLAEGGPLFGQFRNTFSSTFGRTTHDYSQLLLNVEQGFVDEYEWITTSKNICTDCAVRHGVKKKYKDWVEVGLPRSGFSVCESNCKCVLLLASTVPDTFGEPVKVLSIAELRKDFQERLKTDPELQAKLKEYRSNQRAIRDALKNKEIKQNE